MKRKPTFAPYIGSVSSGTMCPEDLIPCFAGELASLLQRCRVDRATRKAHVALVNEANAWDGDAVDGECFVLDELFDALEHYAPPYCYFGAVDGDGADYGFWPVSLDDDDLCRCPDDGSDHKDMWGEDVLLVNDHGNVECGRYDKRGRWHEYWSAV